MRNLAAPARREFLAGLLVLLFGLFFAVFGAHYTIGTPAHMGSGFFPVALGIVLSLIGIAIAAAGLQATEDGPMHDDVIPARPDWRGWGCITAGVAAFIALGTYAGLLPAIFGCVLLSALGDRESTLPGALLLAAVLAVAGTLLFSYGLQSAIPALRT